jgi:uncharacterized protein YutE (UPF0331/DUF86 family)
VTPFDALIPKSLLALYIKLPGGECLAHVDTEGAFELLQANGLLDREPADSLKRMVGFRNVAVHEYASVNLDIVRSIVTRHLDEFLTFSQRLLRLEA